eukprot:CAMPEP_0116062802 /NCGR_PEP_ID=MMETSP0322-20121206/8004_1 /TAXON_ID=163516 /ORGANISM="Leptocylindrus danicus var. apora, Strain B651" /LENGTH=548 /DNA_ID=CAMNT_0003548235 /DNA_START=189 /DNA_END=1835 /DNA_ORIENTATION=-
MRTLLIKNGTQRPQILAAIILYICHSRSSDASFTNSCWSKKHTTFAQSRYGMKYEDDSRNEGMLLYASLRNGGSGKEESLADASKMKSVHSNSNSNSLRRKRGRSSSSSKRNNKLLRSPRNSSSSKKRGKRSEGWKVNSGYDNAVIMSETIKHELLSKDEEKILSRAVKEGQKIRIGIDRLLVDRASQQEELEIRRRLRQEVAEEVSSSSLAGNGAAYEVKTRKTRSSVPDAADLYGKHAIAKEARLTESDIVDVLKIPGGQQELETILRQAAAARTKLIECNLRLVFSLARKTYAKQLGRGTERTYSGTSNLPSLDEVIQEGILGLSRAVDKYDSSLGYRFGTYATYWINSYVQAVFQKTSGGILPVPYNVSTLRSKYNKILKDYYDVNGNSQPPDEKKVAKQLGISVKRLRTVLRATSGIISLDAPITTVDSKNDAISFELYNTISDDGESHPDTYAELALLRQRLEKAMASELSPYERDIVRLRLGLDDGQVKSIREIARMSGRSDISMNDIRSTEKKAYYKLRKPSSLVSHGIYNYSDWSEIYT